MSGNTFKQSLVFPVLIGRMWAAGMVVAVLVVVASAQSPRLDDKAPQAPHSGESFAKPWHIRLPRRVMLEAWERLRNVEIPGIPLDHAYRIDGTEYYVSPEGNDAADGSKDHPWKTLQFAVTHLKSGTVVNLMAGTYYGPVEIAAKATEQSPAALRVAPGQEVVVTYPESYIQQQKGRIARLGSEAPWRRRQGTALSFPDCRHGPYVEITGLHLVGARDRLPITSTRKAASPWPVAEAVAAAYSTMRSKTSGHCGVKEMGHGGSTFLIEGNYIHDLGPTAHDHGSTCRRTMSLFAGISWSTPPAGACTPTPCPSG